MRDVLPAREKKEGPAERGEKRQLLSCLRGGWNHVKKKDSSARSKRGNRHESGEKGKKATPTDPGGREDNRQNVLSLPKKKKSRQTEEERFRPPSRKGSFRPTRERRPSKKKGRRG